MSTLHLKSIQLEQFRQYTASTTIDGLDNGLCIIAGSNEAGKSTLLQAIRAALFDRYKSSVGEQFRPYGAAVSPSVGITFELDGVEYRLSKVFSRKKDGEAVLEFTADKGKERKEGDEAEDYLAELLGFEFSKKGGSRAELQGLAGLLWVEQSKAYESVDLTDNTRRRVQSVFEHEMRDLLGGESGDAIHQHITQMWTEYFGKNGPIGAYRKLSETLAELSSDVDSKYTALEEYEKKVDQLEARQKDLQTYQEDKSLDVSKKRLEEAEAAVQQIAGLRGAVENAKSDVELKVSRFNLAEKEYTTRSKANEELGVSENEAEELDRRSADSAQKLQSAEEEASERLKALEALKQSQLEKDQLLRLASQMDELDGLSTEKATWENKLNDARAVDNQRREAVSNRDAISLVEGDLKELRGIRRHADLAQAKMEAAATSLIYELEEGKTALLDGENIDGSGTALLSEPTGLDVNGIGHFLIKPGGEELETHKSVVADNEAQLKQKLAELALSSLEMAEEKWREKLKFGESAELHQATLEGMTPEGISAIEDRVSTVHAKILELEEKLGDNKGLALDTVALQTELSVLKEQIFAHEDAVREQTPLVNALREAAAAFGAEKKAIQRQIDATRKTLEHARKQTSDDQLLTAYT